jgi:hypothetical protein
VFKKILPAAAVAALALGVSWGASAAASAAPLTYADTSVTAVFQHVDAITGITASFDSTSLGASTIVGSPGHAIGGSHTLTFTAPGGNHGALTWTASEANFPGFSFNLVGNVLTVGAPTSVSAPVASALPTIQVTATDGTAVAKDTLTVTAGTVAPASSSDAGKVDTLTIAQAADTVTLSGANNNATGRVDFTTTPSGANLTLGNAPAGTALSGNSLVAASSVSGKYNGVSVTAKDTAGATAVDTFGITVNGHPVITLPKLPTLPPLANVPFVFGGHVLTGDSNSATVGWSESLGGWPSANHCVEVFVYGFDRPAGTAHVGFTCDNGNRANDVGYLRGLAPGHTYALFVQPATGTYGSNMPIPETNPTAHITVVTPA